MQLLFDCNGRRSLRALTIIPKTWLIMRLTAALLFMACFQVNARSYGQGISLSLKDAPLEKVFREIRKQTGYDFFYNDVWMHKAAKITINVKNTSLEDVLQLCFKNQPFTYTITDKTVILKPKEKNVEAPLPSPVIDIKGKLINEKGEPVIGATIKVKGTNIATMSDGNGEFFLQAVDEEATLIISGAEMQPLEIKVKKRNSITAVVKIKESELDKVVIMAYGTTTRRLNTGNISKVTSEVIEKQPVSNPLLALQGRVPGMIITQQTGVPGGRIDVQIRGRNSIANGSNPLYIIDGVPFTSTSISSTTINGSIIGGGNPLNGINPGDIESIEILKDADATAIYGSRGANGVVLITTKKGKAGNMRVDFNMYAGGGKVTKTMDLLNTSQYLEMRREAFTNDGVSPNASNAYDLLVWDTTRYTDWQKELFGGTAHVANAQLSISGGNANTQYLIAGGYYRETTVFPGDFANRKASVHFNLNGTSTDNKFRIVFSGSYLNDDNNLLTSDLSAIIPPPPNAPAVNDKDGNLNWDVGFENPFATLFRKYKSNTNNIIGNTTLSYKLFKGLQLKSNLGYTQIQIEELGTAPKKSLNPASSTQPSSRFSNGSVKTWIIEPQAEYDLTANKGRLNVVVGLTFQQEMRKRTELNATGFANDNLIENPGSASSVAINNSGTFYSKYRYQAVFGRINYRWEDKYIVNITGRRDGSSRFGPGKQFTNFGALGIAWIFSQEKFIKNELAFISYGKLRASYGTTGNDQIPDYGYLDLLSSTSYPYQGISGLYPIRLFNPEYAWETNKKMEAAIELGFCQNRILFNVSWYQNRSSNQLVGYTLPATTGFTSISNYNLPATVQNTGWEIELSSINIRNKDSRWSTTFNISIPKNKLVSYPDFSSSSYANTYVIGKPLNIVKALHNIGVDPEKGVYQFEDINGSGSGMDIPGDFQALKKIGQSFYGGLENNIQLKNWELDFFFQFVKQTAKNYLGFSGFSAPGTIVNQPSTVMNRWQKADDNTDIQKFTTGSGSGFPAYLAYIYGSLFSDISIRDASFVRLRNVSLVYHIPEKWTRLLHLQTGKLYFQGQNLLTFSNYLGMDPENAGQYKLPPLRVLTFGIHLTF